MRYTCHVKLRYRIGETFRFKDKKCKKQIAYMLVLYICVMDASYTIGQLPAIAEKLWEEGQFQKTWAFYAPMGAGKTTLIHALCEYLGVSSAISSPTFALINEYTGKREKTIYHMDWYRLKDEAEAIQAGIEDCLMSEQLCLIEWPEKAPSLLPDNTFTIHIEISDPVTRRIFTGRI